MRRLLAAALATLALAPVASARTVVEPGGLEPNYVAPSAKLKLGRGKQHFDAIWFNHAEPLGASAYVAYRLDNNTFNGITRVQMVIEHAQ